MIRRTRCLSLPAGRHARSSAISILDKVRESKLSLITANSLLSMRNDRQSLQRVPDVSANFEIGENPEPPPRGVWCNDSIAGRARSAIINAQLETGACGLMESVSSNGFTFKKATSR